MKELMVALLAWIAGEAGFAIPPVPAFTMVSQQEMRKIANGGTTPEEDIRAVYDDASATIFMLDSWDAFDLQNRAVLLHELVHHAQAFNRVPAHCRAQLERQAYQLTVRWLSEQGIRDPFEFLDTDRFTIEMLSICPTSP